MYLLGEFSNVLTQVKQVEVRDINIIDLIEQIIFRVGAANETIEYGLSALFKLYDKFESLRERILKMIRSFESHSDLEVQKRACEYARLLDQSWRDERVKEICIPIPPMRAAADNFSNIPVGDTTMDLETDVLKMPEKLNIDYDEHISNAREGEQREFVGGNVKQQVPNTPNILGSGVIDLGGESTRVTQPPVRRVTSLLDDEDDRPTPATTVPTVPQSNSDPFNILGLDIGAPTTPAVNTGNTGGNLLGGF